MSNIENMTEKEAKGLLNDISDFFSIGSNQRTAIVILTNVSNALDHSFCAKRPDERVLDLANRLATSGAKCCAVSASECHEISDYILENE